MNLLDKIKSLLKDNISHPERVRLTEKNIENWPNFLRLLTEGEIKFDSKGRLRYLHGAPVGDLILMWINKGGTAKYKESSDKWFDPESEKAKNFKWDD